jgi:integrase
LRISEALKLTVADVTRDGLLIRETKFRKTRLVPLHDTAVAGLKRYLAHRRPRSKTDPVFVDARGLPLRYIAVKETLCGRPRGSKTFWSVDRPKLHPCSLRLMLAILEREMVSRGRTHVAGR